MGIPYAEPCNHLSGSTREEADAFFMSLKQFREEAAEVVLPVGPGVAAGTLVIGIFVVVRLQPLTVGLELVVQKILLAHADPVERLFVALKAVRWRDKCREKGDVTELSG